MKTSDEKKLQKLENWDIEKVEIRQPKKPSRVVFSVAFNPNDFERITRYAELVGKKTSEFIRDAAIEKTMRNERLVDFAFGGGSPGAIWVVEHMPTYTKSDGILEQWQYSDVV